MGDYLLSVGRLEAVKRVDLVLRAMSHAPPPVSLVVAGTGTMRPALESLAAELGVSDRVRFLGEVADDEIVRLYSGALGVIFPPYDEDYGYVTLEAFLSGKPVITTTDAGGPTEFVEDGVNGWVAVPDPAAIGAAIGALAANRVQAAAFGAAGRARARAITWDGVIDRLLADA